MEFVPELAIKGIKEHLDKLESMIKTALMSCFDRGNSLAKIEKELWDGEAYAIKKYYVEKQFNGEFKNSIKADIQFMHIVLNDLQRHLNPKVEEGDEINEQEKQMA